MAHPKTANACPICFKTYLAMSNHLQRSHSVVNLEERKLLLNLASRRVNIRACPCPVAGCSYNFKRLDKHLQRAHLELSEGRRGTEMDTVRRKKTIQLLHALRATKPHPPMVTSLDIEPQEYDEAVLEMGEDEPPRQTQHCESCQETAASIQHLVRELQKLRSKYRTLHKKYTRHMKSCRSASIQELSGEVVSREEEAGLSTPSWSPPHDPSQPSSAPQLPSLPDVTNVETSVQFHFLQSNEVPADVQELVQIKEEAPEEQRSDVDQQDQEHLHIKEEEEELCTSLGEEQLNVKEETDATSFSCTAVPLKHEDDEDKPLFLQLHQHQVEVRDLPTSSSADNLEPATGGESCGGAETPRKTDLGTHKDDLDSSETEVSDDDKDDNDVNYHNTQLTHLADSGSKTEDTDKDCRFSPISVPESGVKIRKNRQKLVWCELCGRSFRDKGDLNRHTRTHTGQKPFCCELCNRRFTTKGNLNAHISIHTRQKPFCCKLCGRCFSQKVNLKSHMTIHTGRKPFCCELCDRRFTEKYSLIRHRRIHTGQTPFYCDFCERKYTEKGSLKRHMRIHTENKAVICKDS